jgi:hypothetical protein
VVEVQIALYVHGIFIVFAGNAGHPILLHLQDAVMAIVEACARKIVII